jgi:hypothetical protein
VRLAERFSERFERALTTLGVRAVLELAAPHTCSLARCTGWAVDASTRVGNDEVRRKLAEGGSVLLLSWTTMRGELLHHQVNVARFDVLNQNNTM